MRGVTCSLETCSRQSGLVWRSEERGGQAPTIRQYGGESVKIVSTALPPLLCVSHTNRYNPHTLELHYRGIAGGDGFVSRGSPGGA
jgi:hypothetical protein